MSSRPHRNPGGEAFTRLVLATFRLNGALLRAGDRLTRDLGVSSARWQVLGAINAEPQTVSDIARAMGLRRQGVQPTVNALVDEDLVELRDNPNHRRAKLVALTRQGHRTLAAIDARQTAWANQLAGDTPTSELVRAANLLEAFVDRLSETQE